MAVLGERNGAMASSPPAGARQTVGRSPLIGPQGPPHGPNHARTSLSSNPNPSPNPNANPNPNSHRHKHPNLTPRCNSNPNSAVQQLQSPNSPPLPPLPPPPAPSPKLTSSTASTPAASAGYLSPRNPNSTPLPPPHSPFSPSPPPSPSPSASPSPSPSCSNSIHALATTPPTSTQIRSRPIHSNGHPHPHPHPLPLPLPLLPPHTHGPHAHAHAPVTHANVLHAHGHAPHSPHSHGCVSGEPPEAVARYRLIPPLQMKWQGQQVIGPGLRNLGNTCYLSSVLQCLTHTPPFGNFCRNQLHSKICTKLNPDSPENCPFCILELRIWRSLTSNIEKDAPRQIYSKLKLIAKNFRAGRQEDAHELLRHAIEACNKACIELEKIILGKRCRRNCGCNSTEPSLNPLQENGNFNTSHPKPTPNPSNSPIPICKPDQTLIYNPPECGIKPPNGPQMGCSCGRGPGGRRGGESGPGEEPRTVVQEIFGGTLQSQVQCLACLAESNKIDAMMDLSLDVHRLSSLKEALARFTQPEMLEGDNKYRCERCKRLCSARKAMSIQQAPNVLVIQFKRFENILGGKIDRHIRFDTTVSLAEHMSAGSKDPRPKYDLYGVLVHSGYSQESGHYYAYVKDSSGMWWCCDDASVSQVSLETVLSEKAYMLFYCRDSPRPQIITSQITSSSQHPDAHIHYRVKHSAASLSPSHPLPLPVPLPPSLPPSLPPMKRPLSSAASNEAGTGVSRKVENGIVVGAVGSKLENGNWLAVNGHGNPKNCGQAGKAGVKFVLVKDRARIIGPKPPTKEDEGRQRVVEGGREKKDAGEGAEGERGAEGEGEKAGTGRDVGAATSATSGKEEISAKSGSCIVNSVGESCVGEVSELGEKRDPAEGAGERESVRDSRKEGEEADATAAVAGTEAEAAAGRGEGGEGGGNGGGGERDERAGESRGEGGRGGEGEGGGSEVVAPGVGDSRERASVPLEEQIDAAKTTGEEAVLCGNLTGNRTAQNGGEKPSNDCRDFEVQNTTNDNTAQSSKPSQQVADFHAENGAMLENREKPSSVDRQQETPIPATCAESAKSVITDTAMHGDSPSVTAPTLPPPPQLPPSQPSLPHAEESVPVAVSVPIPVSVSVSVPVSVESHSQNNRMRSPSSPHSPIPSSLHMSTQFSSPVKSATETVSTHVDEPLEQRAEKKPKLTGDFEGQAELLDGFKKRVCEEAREFLLECGWSDEVRKRVRAVKRRRREEKGEPAEGERREMFLEEVRRTERGHIRTAVPQKIKERLYRELNDFFSTKGNFGASLKR